MLFRNTDPLQGRLTFEGGLAAPLRQLVRPVLRVRRAPDALRRMLRLSAAPMMLVVLRVGGQLLKHSGF